MSDEMHDWLTDLAGVTKLPDLVAEALTALLGEGERPGPHLGLTRAQVAARMNVAQDSVSHRTGRAGGQRSPHPGRCIEALGERVVLG